MPCAVRIGDDWSAAAEGETERIGGHPAATGQGGGVEAGHDIAVRDAGDGVFYARVLLAFSFAGWDGSNECPSNQDALLVRWFGETRPAARKAAASVGMPHLTWQQPALPGGSAPGATARRGAIRKLQHKAPGRVSVIGPDAILDRVCMVPDPTRADHWFLNTLTRPFPLDDLPGWSEERRVSHLPGCGPSNPGDGSASH